MFGAIAGDVVGSQYEKHNTSVYDFELFTRFSSFTDDTVMTMAVMESLNTWGDLEPCLRKWQGRFPHAGFGPRFLAWVGGHVPGDSKGNGGAMRVAPYAWMPYTWDDFRKIVEDRTSITHDSREALDGAWAIASTIRLVREGKSREYALERLKEIGPVYRNLTWPPRVKKPGALARESVPAALAAALSSISFEDAIRKAVSIGGDSDTTASMAGALAEALYGVPDDFVKEVRDRVPPDMLRILDEFYEDWVQLDPALVSSNPSFMFERAAAMRYEEAISSLRHSNNEKHQLPKTQGNTMSNAMVRLTAYWGNDDAESSILIKSDDLANIMEGLQCYTYSESWYEGENEQVVWAFKNKLVSIDGEDGRQCLIDVPIDELCVEQIDSNEQKVHTFNELLDKKWPQQQSEPSITASEGQKAHYTTAFHESVNRDNIKDHVLKILKVNQAIRFSGRFTLELPSGRTVNYDCGLALGMWHKKFHQDYRNHFSVDVQWLKHLVPEHLQEVCKLAIASNTPLPKELPELEEIYLDHMGGGSQVSE